MLSGRISNGALMQFAIGLLQSVSVENAIQWRQWFKAAPDAATLATWLAASRL